MTEQQIDQTTDVSDDTTDVVDQTDTPEIDTEDTTDVDEGKEAAKYRRRLRDTEKERDALLEQVDALRRAAIDREVQQQRVAPEGFWASGVTVDQLLDDDGNIDSQKITDAVKDAVTRLGLVRRKPLHVAREGANPHPKDTTSFVDAFK